MISLCLISVSQYKHIITTSLLSAVVAVIIIADWFAHERRSLKGDDLLQ
jgi:hypothetical protein